MKRFIAGFITCLILLSAIFMTGFAENALNVFLNTFPIYINGQQIEVEAYNINGRTFVSIGDVAKYFGATVVNNETEKKIEIKADIPKTLTSTKPKIEYDLNTKLPIGAEIVEYRDCKNAVKYNDKIYLSLGDLSSKFGIKSVFLNVKDHTETFMKNDKIIIVDLNAPDHGFLNSLGTPYYNIDLFTELIGE